MNQNQIESVVQSSQNRIMIVQFWTDKKKSKWSNAPANDECVPSNNLINI